MNIYFRFIGAFSSSAFLVLTIMPFVLKFFKKVHFEQKIRSNGPVAHKKKSGTPTMGGIVLVLSVLTCIFWMEKPGLNMFFLLLIVACSTMVGVIDDYISFKKQRSLGLRAREKFFAQIVIGAVLAVFLIYFYDAPGGIWGLSGGISFLYFLWVILVYTSSCNAVNLTDGLDGLAVSLCVIAFLSYAFIAVFLGEFSLAIFSFAACGACIGFLYYNFYPAKIFMGDAGALGIGGSLACLVLYTRTEFLFIIIGGVFVIEVLSVIIQVAYFKFTHGKRIFKMSPLHHHYELSGWPEVKITKWFLFAGVILSIFGIYLFLITV